MKAVKDQFDKGLGGPGESNAQRRLLLFADAMCELHRHG